jgi:hypothetical protein
MSDICYECRVGNHAVCDRPGICKCAVCDKPAATEHGTGSGEARRDYVRCCFATPRRYRINGNVIVCDNCGREAELPTPPASPTVTLQRWSFVTDDRTGSPVAFPNPNGQWVKYDDALTLLRAAERQK